MFKDLHDVRLLDFLSVSYCITLFFLRGICSRTFRSTVLYNVRDRDREINQFFQRYAYYSLIFQCNKIVFQSTQSKQKANLFFHSFICSVTNLRLSFTETMVLFYMNNILRSVVRDICLLVVVYISPVRLLSGLQSTPLNTFNLWLYILYCSLFILSQEDLLKNISLDSLSQNER